MIIAFMTPQLESHVTSRREEKTENSGLIDTPPWELVLINRDVMWQQQARPAAGNLAVDALTAVRRLRNNLFHGNEASAVHGFVTSHIEQRLRDAVLVLRATVSLLPPVQAAYNSAAL